MNERVKASSGAQKRNYIRRKIEVGVGGVEKVNVFLIYFSEGKLLLARATALL